MNTPRPALPEPTLAAWSRTARPIRLPSPSTPSPRRTPAGVPAAEADDGDHVDDLMFGCSAAVLMAMPLILAAASLVG